MGTVYRTPISLYTSDSDQFLDPSILGWTFYQPSSGSSESELGDAVELAFYYPMSNILDTDDPAGEGEYILAVMDRNRTITRKVVVKEDDLLTPAEVKAQWAEVQKSMLKELLTWANLQCFSRKPLKDATNIIDVR